MTHRNFRFGSHWWTVSIKSISVMPASIPQTLDTEAIQNYLNQFIELWNRERTPRSISFPASWCQVLLESWIKIHLNILLQKCALFQCGIRWSQLFCRFAYMGNHLSIHLMDLSKAYKIIVDCVQKTSRENSDVGEKLERVKILLPKMI